MNTEEVPDSSGPIQCVWTSPGQCTCARPGQNYPFFEFRKAGPHWVKTTVRGYRRWGEHPLEIITQAALEGYLNDPDTLLMEEIL